MTYYLIGEILKECMPDEIQESSCPYVAVLKPDEYRSVKDSFHMGIDMDLNLNRISDTKAVVNYDSLTGTFNIPDHECFSSHKSKVAFALDEKGIVLIDESDYTERLLKRIQQTKRWKLPSLERFIYDFLEETIHNDLPFLEAIEEQLDCMEVMIMKGDISEYPVPLNDIRSDLLDMHKHYEHLIDLARELEENENNFFNENNLRYFRLFGERVERLQDNVSQLREYIVQLRDLIAGELSIKQNKIMTLLTVITAIFMPLTLIAGWYGMNFVDMPELRWRYGYPAVIVISILIVIFSLVYFKKKKWL
ncbi:MAG: hypothetical protein IJH14_05475 [Solobacterium sp.]|nr:hypothetical protein [Solobacterium sp.]